jgi:2-oxoglutarate dehydrogenase E1 component
LSQVHEEVRQTRPEEGDAAEVEPAGEPFEASSAAPLESLRRTLDGLERVPEGFEVHPKLARQLLRRRERFEGGAIDWALAESLAFGSLALEGVPVRLSGEDSGRGTFSQRHAVLYDYRTAAAYVPLDNLSPDQARFTVFDSLLSEFAVLGFEYGYSAAYPEALVMWEAQFGDFVNGAQVVVDQFLVSAESKWGVTSGIVLLLPHGYEGQGPDHSSARLERFLQLASGGNIRVVYPSTPAQYFHLLRLQARHPVRKPLVVLTPKSLLRQRDCVSETDALTGGGFRALLDDPRAVDPDGVRRLLLCSGKVYYDLDAARREADTDDTAVCRVERLYPFPGEQLAELLGRYSGITEVVWVQEEPKNMGAWEFLDRRLAELLPDGVALTYVGRPTSASPATGSNQRHVRQQERLVREALRLSPSG